MKITVRRKNLSNGMKSLYLDIYAPESGKRIKEYLKLYVHATPASKVEREFNKKTEALAENIRSKRLLDLQNTAHGFQVELKKNGNFIDYFHALAQKKMESPGNHGVWGQRLQTSC